MRIAEASISDLQAVLSVERAAFGQDDEAELVRNLLDDPSAEPRLSLLAWVDERPVGHVLFTSARIDDAAQPVSTAILAPLAVVPEAQRQGVGGRLIEHGLGVLSDCGVELVFVAGHPDYYPRHGFEPAMPYGFAPPYPMPPEHEDAWMVRALGEGLIGSIRGRVMCADALNRPEYWRE
jgi:putative acetyltransferase